MSGDPVFRTINWFAQVPISFPNHAARLTALIHCMVSTGLAIRDTVQLERKNIADGTEHWSHICAYASDSTKPVMFTSSACTNYNDAGEDAPRPNEGQTKFALIDRKVHRGGSLGHRATATTIRAAGCTATRIGDRDLRSASAGNCRSGDRNRKLIHGRVACALRRVVPIHHRVSVKAAAIDRQGETWISMISSVRHNCRYCRNNSGLRGSHAGRAVSAAC
jgi:hypothetical protein